MEGIPVVRGEPRERRYMRARVGSFSKPLISTARSNGTPILSLPSAVLSGASSLVYVVKGSG